EEDDLFVLEVVQALPVEDDDLLEARHLAAHRQELVELLVILDEQETAVGIVDQISELGGRIRGVDAGRDAAHTLHAEVGVDPLLAVFRQDRDDLAALEAECEQAEADQPGMLVEIGPGGGQPDAELLPAGGEPRAVTLAALAAP